MSVMYPPETEFAKERIKWEAQQTQMGPGLRPYVFRPYPAMMFKAGRPENGLGAHVITETKIAESEQEATNFRHEGFRATPNEAIDDLNAQQLEFARLAAELNGEQRHKLSERASAEVEVARSKHKATISGHLPSVPVTTIKPRKARKAKES